MTEATGLMKHVVAAMSDATGPGGQGKTPFLRAVALVCWAALSGACGDRSGDPVRAAQAFTAAVQRGDMDAVYPLLEKAATQRLAEAAAQASDQVGGRRRIEPAEMLQIVDVDPNFELASAELLDAPDGPAPDGSLAHVRLTGSQQESHTLTLVLEEGAWRVRIPVPPGASAPDSLPGASAPDSAPGASAPDSASGSSAPASQGPSGLAPAPPTPESQAASAPAPALGPSGP